MEKRDLFAELMQGVEERAAHREGKIFLRREAVEARQEQAERSESEADQVGQVDPLHG